jgi:hypothetical protein
MRCRLFRVRSCPGHLVDCITEEYPASTDGEPHGREREVSMAPEPLGHSTEFTRCDVVPVTQKNERTERDEVAEGIDRWPSVLIPGCLRLEEPRSLPASETIRSHANESGRLLSRVVARYRHEWIAFLSTLIFPALIFGILLPFVKHGTKFRAKSPVIPVAHPVVELTALQAKPAHPARVGWFSRRWHRELAFCYWRPSGWRAQLPRWLLMTSLLLATSPDGTRSSLQLEGGGWTSAYHSRGEGRNGTANS